MPVLAAKLIGYDSEEIKIRYWEKKIAEQDYTNARRVAKPKDLELGDEVFAVNPSTAKGQSSYLKNPFVIIGFEYGILTRMADDGRSWKRSPNDGRLFFHLFLRVDSSSERSRACVRDVRQPTSGGRVIDDTSYSNRG